jgi:DNA-binding MarR family transcriptional regulator
MHKDDAARIQEGVRQLTRRMRNGRANAQLGMSATGILTTLHRLGSMAAARLAEVEKLQPQSLTRLIAALEKQKLILRKPDPNDGRKLVLAITDAGRSALREDLRERRKWLDRALQSLTPKERETLLAAAPVMIKLARQNGDETEEP